MPTGIEHVQKMMKEKDSENHKQFEKNLELEIELDDMKKKYQAL